MERADCLWWADPGAGLLVDVTITEWNGGAVEPGLHADRFGLSFGAVSVGLPSSCTVDTVLRRYLDLVRLVGLDPSVPHEPDPQDLEELARATGLAPACVAERVRSLQR